MSFSSAAKEEMLRQPLGKSCCMLCELSALTQTSGALTFTGSGGIRVTWRLESAGLAKRLFQLLRERLKVSPSLQYIRHARLGGQRISVLTLEEEDARKLLLAFGMMVQEADGTLSLRRTSPHLPVTRQCCRRAFLRAAFLGSGTMSAPEKAYHMEWVTDEESLCQTLEKLLERSGLHPGQHIRKGRYVLYLKDSQQVSDALALMGASNAMLQMENVRIQKQMRGDANRAGNCDEHNADRMLLAAEQQLAAIRAISAAGGLSGLPKALREAAELRLAQPEMSLSELGQLLEPPVGKSGINHRMRRLVGLAEAMNSKEE